MARPLRIEYEDAVYHVTSRQGKDKGKTRERQGKTRKDKERQGVRSTRKTRGQVYTIDRGKTRGKTRGQVYTIDIKSS